MEKGGSNMARPLRIEFPGACYHVMCRGNFRFPVFKEEEDKGLLLRRLSYFADIFSVRVRAYCIMLNHLHCYLQTTEANLGRFMHSFLTSFSRIYNDRHDTSGHVFQGRYKPLLVEDNTNYSTKVSRYIHLNPACTPALKEADFELRRQAARNEKWSSYPALIGLRKCPLWLYQDDLLPPGWGATLPERRKNYAEYVEAGLLKDIWDPEEAATAQCLVGSDNFIERMRRGLTDLSQNLEVRRQSVQKRALRGSHPLEEVIAIVAAYYHCSQESLLHPHSKNNHPRQILLYLAAIYCRGRHTLSEMAERLGPISLSGLGSARERIKVHLQKSTSLRAEIANLESLIADMSNSEH
jgi:REP element-mobilizing transposase RayT